MRPGHMNRRPYFGSQLHAEILPISSPDMSGFAGRRKPSASGSIAERWAGLVLRAVRCESDPKTLNTWACAANVSRSVLSECCRLVHVPPHDARDFARTLRVICRSGERLEPEALMDVADARTLRKLLWHAGLLNVADAPTVEEFFVRQQWIPMENPGLLALRRLFLEVPFEREDPDRFPDTTRP